MSRRHAIASCSALDVGDLDDGAAHRGRLAPWFATVKVGFELYAEAGPGGLRRAAAEGFQVFADLKLHDIPTTVARAARVLGRHGVEFLNFHAAGGAHMLRAGVEAYREGAREAGPRAADRARRHGAHERSRHRRVRRPARHRPPRPAATAWSARRRRSQRCATLRAAHDGARHPPSGDDANDQARVATPAEAIARGADWLVIGRTVTAAGDPSAAAAAVAAEVDAAVAAA